ncbi:MAG: tRNA (guanine(46)-N(7))-methyltransferase TrmB, partial [Wenzhouxiangella sp.]
MADSRLPRTSQTGLHPRLDAVVRRHLETAWQQPLRGFSRTAFATLDEVADAEIVLDAGCGTGYSTAMLASRFPDCRVIGVDRSAARLARSPQMPPNAVLLRADLSDFWRLAKRAGWRLRRHYLLYPNPWPKALHLKRRWHAHPVWPDLIGLSGILELRTNFAVYADEFARALELTGHRAHLRVLSLPVEA